MFSFLGLGGNPIQFPLPVLVPLKIQILVIVNKVSEAITATTGFYDWENC